MLPLLAPLVLIGIGWVLGLSSCASTGNLKSRTRTPSSNTSLLIEPTGLTQLTSDEFYGRLSPDGNRLVYASDQKGQFDLWIKDLTTGLNERITDDVAEDTHPSWSPDGKSIVFTSRRMDVKGDIYLWRNDTVSRLTDSHTEDGYPVFSPDGTSIYFASGPEGKSRIERIAVRSLKRTAVTAFGATHPAISPDGRYLAATHFDEQGVSRLVVFDLLNGNRRIDLTGDEYHVGFPAFSSDGTFLLFSRFYRGRPRSTRNENDIASLWRLRWRERIGDSRRGIIEQLTSDSSSMLFVQGHARGAVVSVRSGGDRGSWDIALIPESGAIPVAADLRAIAKHLSTSEATEWDEVLVWSQLAERVPAMRSEARYRTGALYRDLGELEKAELAWQQLAEDRSRGEADRFREKAAIDLFVLQASQRNAKELSTAIKDFLTLKRSPSTEAYWLLRKADLLRLAKRDAEAISIYETILQRHHREVAITIEARFHLGTLWYAAADRALLSEYYLRLFELYPAETAWLRRAAHAIVNHYRDLPEGEQIIALRRLVDSHPHKMVFVVVASRRVAELYEKQGKIELAIEVLQRISHTKRSIAEIDDAAFDMGRLAYEYSTTLRRKQAHHRALHFYGIASRAYETILKRYAQGDPRYERAKTEYVRLALLEAAQFERQQEFALAETRYRQLLAFDGTLVEAHRRFIRLRLRQRKASNHLSERDFLKANDEDDNALRQYIAGYLSTLSVPLTKRDLDRAQKILEEVVQRSPQNVYGQMTLGWVYEMRERLLKEVGRGWLEEAIVRYERAYALNDRRVFVQTEADLLLNLCQAFAQLGNGWKVAYGYCDQRATLHFPFDQPLQEIAFYLTYGRAATATGKFEVADRAFEHAADQARVLRQPELVAELSARRALNALEQGNYAQAQSLFSNAAALFKQSGKVKQLAILTRSRAYSVWKEGRLDDASKLVAEAAALLSQHGVPSLESWTAQSLTSGPSTDPFGFAGADERYVQHGMTALIERAKQQWPTVLKSLQTQLALREDRAKTDPFPELTQEIAMLRGHLAMTYERLDLDDKALTAFSEALNSARRVQQDDSGRYKPQVQSFPLEVGLALNRAELFLNGPSRDIDALRAMYEKLHALHIADETSRQRDGVTLLSARLRYALWNNLALLAVRIGVERFVEEESTGETPSAQTRARDVRMLVRDELSGTGKAWSWFQRAIQFFRRVERATRPALNDPSATVPTLDETSVGEYLFPLVKPLTFIERIRWHVQASLNLIRVASAYVEKTALEAHPTTAHLERLARLCAQYDLGVFRFVVAGELAYRRNDLHAMRAAIEGYLVRSPFLVPLQDLKQGDSVRRSLFQRAIELALEKKDLTTALTFSEMEARRGFSEDLILANPQGYGRTAKPIRELLAIAAQFQAHTSTQTEIVGAVTTDETYAAWWRKRDALERHLAQTFKELNDTETRTHDLFVVGQFPLKQIQAALNDKEGILTAIESADAIHFVLIQHEASLRSVSVPKSFGLKTSSSGASFLATVKTALKRLLGSTKRVYVDRYRLEELDGTAFDIMGVLHFVEEKASLATVWQWMDAHEVRNVSFKGPVTVLSDSSSTSSFAESKNQKNLAAWDLTLEQSSVTLLEAPLVAQGDSTANLSVAFRWNDRPHQFHFARQLGFPWRGTLVVIGKASLGSRRKQRQKLALMRLFHAMGIPSVMIRDTAIDDSPRLPDTVRQIAEALSRSATISNIPSSMTLFGNAGFDPDSAKTWSTAELKRRVFAGAKAFKARALPQMVELLEGALRYMDYVGDNQYRDGALLFCANAYGLLEDYPRAIATLNQLIALRKTIAENAESLSEKSTGRQKPSATIKATVQWASALQTLAWTQLRADRVHEALVANQRAIALLENISDENELRAAYEQRSLLAERAGDVPQAILHARRAFEASQQLLERKNGSAIATTYVKSALRLSRLLRARASKYHEATHVLDLAEKQAPKVPSEVPLDFKTSTQAAALLDGVRIQEELSTERARIASAKGDFTAAVTYAQRALALTHAWGVSQDVPLLEIVNNLYYLGAYQQALHVAEEGLTQTREQPLRSLQFLNAKGTIYAALGDEANALQVLEEALSVARSLNNENEISASLNNLGNALRLAGRFSDAIKRFSAALEIDRRRNDLSSMTFALANLGLTERQRHNADAAHRYFQDAIRLSKKIGAPLNELKALSGLVELALEKDRTDEALRHARDGIALATSLGLREWLWRFCLYEGQGYRRQKDNLRAWSSLRLGLRIIEELPPRLRRTHGTQKIELAPEDLFDEAIDLLAVQEKSTEALELSERLHARSLYDLVHRGIGRIPLASMQQRLATLTTVNHAIEFARARRLGTETKPEQDALSAELTTLLEKKRTLVAELGSLYPRLLPIVSNETHSLSQLSSHLAQLGDDTRLVRFHLGKHALLIWTLTPRATLSMQRVSVDAKTVEEIIERLRKKLGAFYSVEPELKQLYQWLIAPFAQTLTRRLVIIPSGALHFVPFAALFDGKRYLVERHALSILPSLNALRVGKKDSVPDASMTPPLSVSAPRFDSNDADRVSRAIELPFARQEATAFAHAMKTDRVYTGDAATTERFFKEAPSSSLIHLATHMEFNPDDPLSSAILFRDRTLSLVEILGLKLSATLTVLSGCDSGLGVLDSGESLSSASHAFLMAGSQQVLSSLWRLNDLSTAILMKHFFRNVAETHRTAEALQAAQNKLRNRFSHPAFWAGMQLQGW